MTAARAASRLLRMADDHIIETVDLSKRFGERIAVDRVTLSVPRGCAFGFLGHNGAGKTTTIRMLLGLTGSDGGTMSVRGLAVPARRREALSRVGAIVEEPHFHGQLTGRENMRIVAAVRGPETFARIDGALARVGLAERADERVSRYSQGMRQRLGVARCLLADPELLVLDEPTNGLDPAGILEFRQMIRSLVAEGRTVFLSSHLLDEVERACDAAAIIDGGRIVTSGPISELTRSRHSELVIACDSPDQAVELLLGAPGVLAVERSSPALLRLRLDRTGAASDVNRRLVLAGIGVSRLEPVHESLEQRFLEVTSRLEAVA